MPGWIDRLMGRDEKPKPRAPKKPPAASPPPKAPTSRLPLLVPRGALVLAGQAVASVPEDTPEEQVLRYIGEGAERSEDETQVVASAAGLVDVQGEAVTLRPFFRMSEDKLQVVQLQVPGVDAAPGEDLLHEALRAAGMDPALFQDLSSSQEAAVLVQGRAPTQGEHGSLEVLISAPTTSTARADGSVDFRDLQMESAMVRKGDEVALIHRAQPGVHGVDVFGQVLPADEVKELVLTPGEGVALRGDQVIATQDGRLKVEGPKIQVDPTLLFTGDVGYGTGHVNARAVGVCIRGSVLPGFKVLAGQCIEIKGTVEDATIRCGNHVSVGEGIICREGGSLRARGGVRARYTQSALIYSVEDVVVSGGISLSRIWSCGAVQAAGRQGGIRGGEIYALRGVHASSLGSERHGTAVRVGNRDDALDTLQAIAEPLEIRLMDLELALGSWAQKSTPEQVPSRLRDDMTEFLQLTAGVAALRSRQEALQADERLALDARVRVDKVCHAGVKVTIGVASLTVERPLKAVEFYLDPETRQVRHGPIGASEEPAQAA